MNHKTFKKISVIFSLIILLIFIFSLINYKVLKKSLDETLSNQVGNYGYFAVFLISYAVEILPQPFVSALVPFANGLVLELEYSFLLIYTLIAVVLSSLTGYAIGLLYGKKFTMKIFGKEKYDKYNRLFKKYGNYAMTIAAFTPFPYLPIVPGVFKMKLKNFILFALIPRITYITVFTYVLSLVL